MDRISLLPDRLLHHILSFLNTKLVVQTCVVSKRWKDLWLYISTLNLSFSSYQLLNPAPSKDVKKESFHQFVMRVLFTNRPQFWKIDKLTILYHSGKDIDKRLFQQLFHFAVLHRVEELHINARRVSSIDWSSCLSTLQSLKLIGVFKHWKPLSLDFLKTLEIVKYHRSVSRFKFLRVDMFSSCPNLESLIIQGHTFKSICITAPKLEYLEIGYPYIPKPFLANDDQFISTWMPETELSTPKLSHVKFDSFLPSMRWVCDPPCLDKVILTLKNDNFSDRGLSDPIAFEEYASKILLGLFNLLENTASLTLCMAAAETISLFKRFQKEGDDVLNQTLRHLKLLIDKDEGRVPEYILNYCLKSPTLKTFNIVHSKKKMKKK